MIGPRDSITFKDFTWQGIKGNLAKNISLGLDLKGGSRLVMRVKTEKYLKKITENNQESAFTAAKEKDLPVVESSSIAEKGTYSVTLKVSDSSKNKEIIDAVREKGVDFLDWTLTQSADEITWSLPNAQQKILKKQSAEQAMRIIDGRINKYGVTEPTLQRRGTEDSGEIVLQMPGLDDPERVKKLIKVESELYLMKLVSPPNPNPVQVYPTREAALQTIGGKETTARKVFEYVERDQPTDSTQKQPDIPKQWVVVESPAIIEGSELRDASAVTRTGNEGDYQITFSLKPAGAKKFGAWTGQNINNYMAVVLNGQVKSAAFIRSAIFDSGEISGQFTKATAEDLALTLKSGALPAAIEFLEERTVGPSLGADAIRAGLQASIGGLVFIVLFMLFYYRGAGINAVIALTLNMMLTIAALIVLGGTLTLPGMAGLILGIGMAVDSNVLIFERMREEIRAGKAIAESVKLGFDRAWLTIIDSHVTTIIAGVILYLYGSGPIRGFAVTLILGLLINLFSAVFVSRTIFLWILERNPNIKKLSV